MSRSHLLACTAAALGSLAAAHKGSALPSLLRTNSRAAVDTLRGQVASLRQVDAVDAAASVTASLGACHLSYCDVHVEWASPSDTSSDALLMLHCAEYAEAASDMIDFANVSRTGSADFRLHHIPHCDYSFSLAHLTSTSVTRLASSAAVALDTTGEDVQPWDARISFGPSPSTSMWVSWTSSNGTAPPVVHLGTSSGNYTRVVTGNSSTYTASDMCGSPANVTFIAYFIDPGYMHNVLVTGLQPGVTYYAVFGQSPSAMSAETTFRTAKPASASTNTRFVMYGDMALSFWPGALSTVENVALQHAHTPIDVVLHIGDLGYAMGSAIQWPIWHAYIEPVSRQIPYQVTVGNHEYDHLADCPQDPSGAPGNGWHPVWGDLGDDSSGEGGVPTAARFHGTGNGNGVFWYSFDVGNVHFLLFSSEHDFTPGSVQYTWMEADLAAVNRSVTPWIVTAQHRPMYSAEVDSAHFFGQGMVTALEPLFLQYGVRLNLAGHVHDYLRPCPMVNYTCTSSQQGITYMTIGTAGATVHNESIFANQTYTVQSYLVEWGFAVIETANASAMHLQFIANSNNATADEVWIYQ